ncbi:copper-binding protein [Azomonas macrocytogenes]|uniref:Cu/Ag efflux protein CusF n=1 Tax=Azomonas macrocytogenes TaxID=69962 RepID=A0A839T5X8_AZOMA|nr:copper-binding protein [Azomonas macrocytogenes]MBB3103345.1 Cu/Ag efflux protein CusF [Azomonas macrocytogenes]
MNILIPIFASLVVLPVAYADHPEHGDHASVVQKAATETVSTSGTVKQIDKENGALVIAHEAVPALQWPAMTMPFKATAEQLTQVEVGEKVDFEFSTEGVASIVSIGEAD